MFINVTMIFTFPGGGFCVAAPLYTSEIAEKHIRGALGSYFQLLLTVGILFAYVFGTVASPRILSVLCACVPIVFGLVFFFQPETPVRTPLLLFRSVHEK